MESLVKTITVCFQKPFHAFSNYFKHAYQHSIQTKIVEHGWATGIADSLIDNEC